MQFKDIKELRSLERKALLKELHETTNLLKDLKFSNRQGGLKDNSQLGKTRAYRARLRSIQSERINEEKNKPAEVTTK